MAKERSDEAQESVLHRGGGERYGIVESGAGSKMRDSRRRTENHSILGRNVI